MEGKKDYIKLKDLEVYKLSRELSAIAWEIYSALSWRDMKTMGDQFLESTDSTGANVAEGYGRFHYLDRIKFYYYSRASYFECQEHWLSLLYERNKVDKQLFERFNEVGEKFQLKLNNFIASTYKTKYQPYKE